MTAFDPAAEAAYYDDLTSEELEALMRDGEEVELVPVAHCPLGHRHRVPEESLAAARAEMPPVAGFRLLHDSGWMDWRLWHCPGGEVL